MTVSSVQTLQMILIGHRIPKKYVNIIKILYDDFHCKVICGSTANDRQLCCLDTVKDPQRSQVSSEVS